MSSGIVYMGAITASATPVYSVAAGYVATVNIRCFNPNSSNATFDVGVAESATSVAKSSLEFSQDLAAKSVIEQVGIVLGAGQTVIVSASASSAIYVTIWGFEDAEVSA